MKRAREVYEGSNGDVTKAYYAALEVRGALGIIAVNLFRAHKCSSRAKKYRGSFKGMAYDRKNWSLTQLCEALSDYGGRKRCADPMIDYGWKKDPGTPGYEWVLYVDLPQGQVSFHAASRGEGPDYAGEWCGDHLSADRILAFCDNVMGESQPLGINGILGCLPEAMLDSVTATYQGLSRDVVPHKFGMGNLHPEHAVVTPSEAKQDSLFQTSGKESDGTEQRD